MSHHGASPKVTAASPSSALAELGDLMRAEIERELPFAFELRKKLHQAPRVSGEEGETSRWLLELVEFDMEPTAHTGFVGRFGPTEGSSVLVRAELDALPVEEQTGVEWASQNGAMHACGHDVHMAAWVAFCRAASRFPLPKAIAAVLQPREEAHPSGAQDIVDEGWLERLNIDAALAVHVHPAVHRNQLAIGPGCINAAADTLKVTYRGHGAYPHLASSPVPALVSLAAVLPQLRQNVVDPTEPGVLTVGKIIAGDAANVIPAEGRLEATIRSTSEETREKLYESITELVHSTARPWNLDVEMVIEKGEPVLMNEEQFALRAQEKAQQLGLEIAPGIYSCGSDDFSYFSERVPSIMIFAGVGTAGELVNLHSPMFLPEQATVRTVALAYLAGYLAAVEKDMVAL